MMAEDAPSPTVPPPRLEGMNSALTRNIDAMHDRRRKEKDKISLQHRAAIAITAFTGSMAFVYIHLAALAMWIMINIGLVSLVRPFDPSFIILSTGASVEAIFLSTFVLISQNRAAKAADRRADLDLQINLLTEHEVTRLISLTSAIAAKLGIEHADTDELTELKRDVAPEMVLDTLERGHQMT